MKNNIKSAVIALFSSLWLVGILGAANRCLMVARGQHASPPLTSEHVVRLLEDARRDFIIGGVWLVVVVFFWAFRLSRSTTKSP